MCSPRPTLIYLHNHTMSKTASSDAHFMDNKSQRWNDLYRVIKLVNDTLEDVSPTSSSLPGERWRILEHSQVLISHPKSLLGGSVNLGNWSNGYSIQRLAPGVTEGQGPCKSHSQGREVRAETGTLPLGVFSLALCLTFWWRLKTKESVKLGHPLLFMSKRRQNLQIFPKLLLFQFYTFCYLFPCSTFFIPSFLSLLISDSFQSSSHSIPPPSFPEQVPWEIRIRQEKGGNGIKDRWSSRQRTLATQGSKSPQAERITQIWSCTGIQSGNFLHLKQKSRGKGKERQWRDKTLFEA